MKLLINQIKIPFAKKGNEMELVSKKISDMLHIPLAKLGAISIQKKSIDARKKPELYYVYSVIYDCDDKYASKLLKNNNITKYCPVKYKFPVKKNDKSIKRPVIIGSGPAGLFCGYMLASYGFKPVIIERGSEVRKRKEAVHHFWNTGELDSECNVQFGEGGAGTFSDGKLMTGVKDKSGRIDKILDIFIENGSSKDLKISPKPHIGTDVLENVVVNMRQHILDNGGEYHFDVKLHDINIEDGSLKSIELMYRDGKVSLLDTDMLILAIGHSSRDTFKMLHSHNLNMENKPFAIGYRVSHNQKDINDSRYGFNDDSLPAADYKVTYQADSGRGVYSFCMCPGGYVVNSSSHTDKLTVNGMSYSRRDSANANSAIVLTVTEDDYGHELFDGMKFQEQIESNAYNTGQGKIVFQRFSDYKDNKPSDDIDGEVLPICKGLFMYGNQRGILNNAFEEDFIEAMEYFGRIIPGFNNDDVLICGVESRTSSPVKILRDEHFESNIRGIFPCGEGAGYAGGITSAALDGIKVAEEIAVRLAE